MSKFCETCGRGALSAQIRSHANNATKTRKFVNLQVKRLNGKTYRLCTRCLRTMVKQPEWIKKAGTVARRLTSRTKNKATKPGTHKEKGKSHTWTFGK